MMNLNIMIPRKTCYILRWAEKELKSKDIATARHDSEIMLACVLKINRIGLYLEPYREITNEELSQFLQMLNRRFNFEPLQYILNKEEFHGNDFLVTKDVFIPRPETELLVEKAVSIIKSNRGENDTINVVDLCTGCGNVAISIAKNIPNTIIFAVDISSSVLEIAKKNVMKEGLQKRIKLLKGDLFEPILPLNMENSIDIVVSNPPYIARESLNELPLEVREFEPEIALDGGPGGIEIHRRILENSPTFLKKSGFLLMEIGFNQATILKELIKMNNFLDGVEFEKDILGIDRVLITRRL